MLEIKAHKNSHRPRVTGRGNPYKYRYEVIELRHQIETMVSTKEENPVYGIRLSSVGPSRATGSGVVHDPSSMDLAMKLHYLKGVYFFSSRAVEGLTVGRLKETTFEWLNEYYYTSGRVWRSEESGRPYIKCNDCGSRFIEAHSDKTIDEWLETKDRSLENLLVSQQVIGPELSFSPPVLIQVLFWLLVILL